ncbi:MAG: tetratricopeptide repeat protein [Anaerolineales bacterium]|nr:tetratricopeptide repeat protein [Anaerolineales bacterium]MBN2702758.1 tetratricopeptide repeat protein [Pontiellaceae bacterium]
MAAKWKTITLFISSTFRDMHAERDELNNVVFPALADRLKTRRCRLEPIDLRVGVETDSSQTERERELQILKVCLAEIERSRPFLLVLLGDRYGWVPGSDRIEAASGEAGFTPDDNGGSVTALEIEYGLLKKEPVQRRRCLLCMRDPLPYDRMPKKTAAIYSDAHATDPDAPDRVQRLKKLKAKMLADPELASHRLPYRLDWNDAPQLPDVEGEYGIKAWGQKVEKALWVLIDDETREFAAQEEPTWQEEEQFVIEEFVERLNGSFIGREALVGEALDLAASPTDDSSPWGLCFEGKTGSGKSALFAHLHHELSQQKEMLLLSHAAGVSPRSGQTEWMLRRWIGELGDVLGETPDAPEDIRPEDLEKLFAQLLHRAATGRRVVLLVDALNQFVRTDRARTVSWLPAILPDNVRFIATAIPGDETRNLSQRKGLKRFEVPPLDVSEADRVTAQVYGRYHRQPNKEVVQAVMALRLPDGSPAAGNPLWLTLALDLLNQLDTDDFTAAEAGTGGSPEEKLRRMVLERARNLPPDVEGLYGHLLTRVEKVAGREETRALAALIALSRNGWREEDFQHLLPKATALIASNDQRSTINAELCHWDPLRFAVMRRCFRMHLVKRGALEQWEFAHATLRQAILQRIDNDWQTGRNDNLQQAMYSCGADYLETLPPGTSVRKDEIMWQMLGTRDAPRVASYYAQPTSDSELLALFLMEEKHTSSDSLLCFASSLLDVKNSQQRAAIAHKFIYDLYDALNTESQLELQELILTDSLATLLNLVDTEPNITHTQRTITVCCNKMGDVRLNRGDLTGALQHYEAARGNAKRLAFIQPESAFWHDFAMSLVNCGDAYRSQGNTEKSLESLQYALDIATRGAQSKSSSTDWQSSLFTINSYIGEVAKDKGDIKQSLEYFRIAKKIAERMEESERGNTYWKNAHAASHRLIGEILQDQGNFRDALLHFYKSLSILEHLTDANPLNTECQRNLSVSYNKIGDVQHIQGDLTGALKRYPDALTIRERLADSNPDNAFCQRDLSVSLNNVGNVQRDQGDLNGALRSYRDALAIRERLADEDLSNIKAQLDLISNTDNIGIALLDAGKSQDALGLFLSLQLKIQGLIALQPDNHDLLREYSILFNHIGDVHLDQGDQLEALKDYRNALSIQENLIKKNQTLKNGNTTFL